MSAVYKLSGGGNDFLALVEAERDPTTAEIVAWCRRGLSIGADGVFTLTRTGAAARMRYWNADGSLGRLCLNGTRCAARLAFELGWGGDEVTIVTDAGALAARRTGADEVAVAVPLPEAAPREVALVVDGVAYPGHLVVVGVPHLVLVWPGDLAAAPVASLGAALRAHAALAPTGANVDFARFPTPHQLELRTFERGVEAETLACGTGVLASVATGLGCGHCVLPIEARTRGGFVFTVEGEAHHGTPHHWTLAGDARLVARLDLLPGAAAPVPGPTGSLVW